MTERQKEVARLNAMQRADFDAAMQAMRGVDTYEAGKLWFRYLTPGVNYTGSAKWRMALDFARRTEIGNKHCAHLTVERILRAMV